MGKVFEVGEGIEYRGHAPGSTIRPWEIGVVDAVRDDGLVIRKSSGRLLSFAVPLADVRKQRQRKDVREMHVAPSRGPARHPLYLAYVRAKPCCHCSAPGPSDPHHFGVRGTGQKTDDFRTVPLCRKCHGHYHATGALPRLDSEDTITFLAQMQVDLLVRWVTVGA